jgi:formylglycine-generating enzyme required for sulfatase activity
MAEVFISYSQKDRALIAPIVAALKELGVDVWYDPEILPGQSFGAVILARLKEAKAVLVCWTPEATASDWVKGEADYARKLGAYVPVFIAPCELEPPFNRIHTADLSQWKGARDDPAWLKLVSRLAQLIGREGVAARARALASGDEAATAPTEPAPGRPSRRALLIVGIVALVGVVAASVGLIAMREPSGLAPSPTQTPMAVASASPAPTPAPAMSAAPSPTPTTVAPASPSPIPIATPTPTPTSAASPAKPGACDGSGAPLASLSARSPGALSAAEECALKPKDAFRECAHCPVMVVLPPGSFTMGSPASEPGRDVGEGPQHDVRIAKLFAVGEFQVTVDEFKAFVTATGYDAGSTCYAWNGKSWELQSGRSWRDPGFAQTGSHPVACVNWNDAQAYAKWLSGKTGKSYRLPSEAEWEYAARGRTAPGSYPRYFFGDSEADFCKYGNGADQTAQKQIPGAEDWKVLPCSDGYAYTSPVGSFRPNDFGLFDMHGNVWQWVVDCYHENYTGAPKDGSAWTGGVCETRILRGSSWDDDLRYLRAANRGSLSPDKRGSSLGFRLARTLSP